MDETIDCTMTIDEENQKIVIAGLTEQDFEIEYSSDIDFTDLVSNLTEKIDTLQKINISLDSEPTDEKIKLVTGTIKEIFDLYNQNIVEEGSAVEASSVVADDEIPF